MGFNNTRKPTTMYSNFKPLPATQAHTAYFGNAAGAPRQTLPPRQPTTQNVGTTPPLPIGGTKPPSLQAITNPYPMMPPPGMAQLPGAVGQPIMAGAQNPGMQVPLDQSQGGNNDMMVMGPGAVGSPIMMPYNPTGMTLPSTQGGAMQGPDLNNLVAMGIDPTIAQQMISGTYTGPSIQVGQGGISGPIMPTPMQGPVIQQ